MNNLECPLWGNSKVGTFHNGNVKVDNTRAGGAYEINGSAVAILKHKRTDLLAAKLTTWIIDQHRSGIERPVINSGVLNLMDVRPRLNIAEQIDRFFLMLAFLDARADFSLKWAGTTDAKWEHDRSELAAWLECETASELGGIVTLLIQDGLVEGRELLRMTPAGIRRLAEVQRHGISSRQAFIAMWFDPSMNDAATKGFELAISAAGYSPLRIDKKEHNNKIDDEIVAEIKKSRFVVADFTSELVGEGSDKKAIARGGVYFEAGLALGLGLPVIWCCRKDVIGHVHFDTRQFAHVVWSTPEDLARNLYNRICAVIGETSDAPGLPQVVVG